MPYMILGARGNDDGAGGWLQILIFLVVAVFYVLGNINQARSRKREELSDSEPSESKPRPPARRIQVPAGRILKKTASIRLSAPQKTFNYKAKSEPEPERIMPQPAEPLPAAATKHEPEPAATEPERKTAIELIDLDKPDELARGIIYCEILGKPLAFREPWAEE